MLEHFWRNLPPVVKNLLLINLLVFIGINLLNENLLYELGLFYFDHPLFKPMQVVTSMFTHKEFGHFFFNMFALLMFGSALERIWGPKRFLTFFLACGLGASFIQEIVQAFQVYYASGVFRAYEAELVLSEINYPMLKEVYSTVAFGASGAIFGIMIGFAMLFPNTELMMLFFPVPIKAKYLIPIMIVLELYLSINNFAWDNVGHYAHLGGALIGFILIKIWTKNRNTFY